MNLDLLSIFSGIIAILVASILSVMLLFGLYKLNLAVTRKFSEVEAIKNNNKSVALVLGSMIISQALLLRHAVVPVMSSVRNLFVYPGNHISVFQVIAFSTLFMAIFGILAFLLVWISTVLFSFMTRSLDEQSEVRKDNFAVAVFLSAVILASAVVIDQGMADLAQSLIMMPDSGTGIISLN
jgi:uncharacterized membrane protein YjfL (UPF0719 family)